MEELDHVREGSGPRLSCRGSLHGGRLGAAGRALHHLADEEAEDLGLTRTVLSGLRGKLRDDRVHPASIWVPSFT